ncbi:hypothetical protein Y1Q_0024585 [Alligator mississippiensis]|uniref:Uncharacterized protein n=1 Tax=Alligator mississippiensis TaxID=8496 RepID=A0A151NBY2_ALLMI|nr:hypothetical protein Y1Q_0024585 [Alligator mississippiensis]
MFNLYQGLDCHIMSNLWKEWTVRFVRLSSSSRQWFLITLGPADRLCSSPAQGEGKGRRTSWVHLNQKSKHSLWLHPRC